MAPPSTDLFAPGVWPAFVYLSTRLTGMMIVAPFWSLAAVPRTVRGAIVVALAALLAPLGPVSPAPVSPLTMPAIMATELLIGLAIGLAAAIVSQALLVASEVVSLQMGLSLGQLLVPSAETGGAGLSQLYGLLGLAAFVGVGGPLAFIEAVARSAAEVPPGTAIDSAATALGVLGAVGKIFGYAIQIAAPVLLAVTVANIGIGIISRAVPQLNAMAMSFAVTVGVGLMMLGVSIGAVAGLTSRWFGESPAVADALVRGLVGGGGR